ncbi:30S ribosomal protein S7 [Candidatus Microgenomates bacterium]|nr:30S ribosomal protein S7 [Candidatus Microgenomates bacterium]
MPRRGPVPARTIAPDPVYGHKLVAKLISRIMHDGKKSVAAGLVYRAFEAMQKETGEDPLKVFLSAVEQIKPTMEVRPRRVGGAAYQVPIPVRGPRRESLAIRWLILAAQKRPNKDYHTFTDKLTAEILDASKGQGGAIAKKKEVERVAEANRAFSHFRW